MSSDHPSDPVLDPPDPRRTLAYRASEIAGREDLLAEELRIAARALGRLTGRVDVEDILDVIFRDFCIGK